MGEAWTCRDGSRETEVKERETQKAKAWKWESSLLGQEAACGSLIACKRPSAQALEGSRNEQGVVYGGIVSLSLDT